MKNPVAYYLLLIYLVAICQPIIPWVQDVVAHTFFESEHIATVHHQNGKHHVDYELRKLASKTSSNSFENTSYSNLPLHTPVTCELVFHIYPPKNKIIFYHTVDCLPVAFMAIHIPPPRV